MSHRRRAFVPVRRARPPALVKIPVPIPTPPWTDAEVLGIYLIVTGVAMLAYAAHRRSG